MRFFAVFGVLVLAACTAPQTAPSTERLAAFSQQLRNSPTGSVCATVLSSQTSPLTRQMAEAELGVRGVNLCSNRNYGRSTAAQFGQTIYDRNQSPKAERAVTDRDCSNFSNGASAQRFFLAEGGPLGDPHDLDRDGDGLACEWGPQVRRIASTSIPRVVVQPRVQAPRSSRQCYTGPRGGTYTLTSSGSKNYGGC